MCLFVTGIQYKQSAKQPLRRLTPPAPLACYALWVQWSQDVANLWKCCFVFDIYLQIILFKMLFRYKITSRTGSKTCPPCVREGVGVADRRVAQNNFSHKNKPNKYKSLKFLYGRNKTSVVNHNLFKNLICSFSLSNPMAR